MKWKEARKLLDKGLQIQAVGDANTLYMKRGEKIVRVAAYTFVDEISQYSVELLGDDWQTEWKEVDGVVPMEMPRSKWKIVSRD